MNLLNRSVLRAMLNSTDWSLLTSEKSNEEVFEHLFLLHGDFVYRVAFGFVANDELARDVAQEVFYRLMKKRRKWKKKAQLRTLLYRMTYLVSREAMRKERRQQLLKGFLKHRQDRIHLMDEPNWKSEKNLHNLLRLLPPKQRAVVVLRIFEQCSVEETARILKCRPGTVKAHLHKAIERLRKMLKTNDSSEVG